MHDWLLCGNTKKGRAKVRDKFSKVSEGEWKVEGTRKEKQACGEERKEKARKHIEMKLRKKESYCRDGPSRWDNRNKMASKQLSQMHNLCTNVNFVQLKCWWIKLIAHHVETFSIYIIQIYLILVVIVWMYECKMKIQNLAPVIEDTAVWIHTSLHLHSIIQTAFTEASQCGYGPKNEMSQSLGPFDNSALVPTWLYNS